MFPILNDITTEILHINEKGDGPYRGFGYLSLVSDPLYLARNSQSELLLVFNKIVDRKTDIIQKKPNILNGG